MERARYDSELDDTRYRLRSWQRVAVMLIVIDLILAIRIVTLGTHEKTIVVPATPFQEFWVQGNQVSPSYLEAMGRYFAGLMLTYSPSGFAAQKDIVLRYADPAVHGPLETQLTGDAEKIRRNRVSQVFYPAQTRIRAEALEVAIDGDLAVFVGQEPLTPRRARYLIRFVNRGGQLYVAAFQETPNESDPFGDHDHPADGQG